MIVVELNICLFKMKNLKLEKFQRNYDKVMIELNKKKIGKNINNIWVLYFFVFNDCQIYSFINCERKYMYEVYYCFIYSFC